MKTALLIIRVYAAALIFICPPSVFGKDEYEFDLSEIEKEIERKPYSIGGFLELRPVVFGLDRDAAFYRIKFPDQDQGVI